MYNKRGSTWQTADWLTIGLYILMIVAGWFSICGASFEYDAGDLFDPSARPGQQLIWIGSALILVFIILMLDKDFFETFSYPIYSAVLLLLIAAIFFAPDIKGSRSWLVLGPVRFQPAEFAKFATALALARLMSGYYFNFFSFRHIMQVVLLIAAPMLCILLQKETGSALVFLAFGLMLYREGMSVFILLASICAVTFFIIIMKFNNEITGITPVGELIVSSIVLVISALLVLFLRKDRRTVHIMIYLTVLSLLVAFVVSLYVPVNFAIVMVGLIAVISCMLIFLSLKNLVWHYALVAIFAVFSIAFMFSADYVFEDVLEPHQQVRIKVALGMEDDPGGAGYNVNQSKIAIGSGGLFGKGFLNGTQTKLKYVPEQDTDFIFCTVGEEFGFAGSVTVLLLFAVLIIRLIFLAERQDTAYGRVYGYTVASVFLFHVLINVGMVIGLTPVIGIPLPFFSYGGSSLWGFTVLLFILLRLDAGRKER
ncbi:MAG: rod shape-determining protein RodA [Tannerella sp.]|jgi:rod shape determining protein RodA|nr:rod shape-determining protein RodA [Tannerella sp.]